MASASAPDWGAIRVRGARENNLRDINLDIPKRRFTVFTGVSGSGNGAAVRLRRLGTLQDEYGDARLEQPEVRQERPRLLVAEWQERGGQRLTGSTADTRPGTDTSDVGNPAK